MRLINVFLILSMLGTLATSCIKRIPKENRTDATVIDYMDGPRVIRDTIIKEVVIERGIEIEDTEDIVQVQQPKPTSRAAASSTPRNDDRYDRNNSGFFDQYQQNYQGDPNRNLKPTTRVVGSDNSREIQAIEKTLERLEKENQVGLERQQEIEQERQRVNQQILENAREQENTQRQRQKPQGKTLDTDLLNNGRR